MTRTPTKAGLAPLIDAEKLRALDEAATKGPWACFDSSYGNDTIAIMQGKRPAKARWKQVIGWPGFDQNEQPANRQRPNQELIVELRNAVPAILAMHDLIESQAAEIAQLQLDLEAAHCLMDCQYKAGVKLGWNLCTDDDEAGYQRVMASTEHIAELKRIQAARQALAAAGLEIQEGDKP